jgi:serine/threonine protein kinase
LKTSGSFVVEKKEDKKLYRRRQFDADTVLNAVNRHKEACSLKGPEFVKATPKRSVTSFCLADRDETRVYVKEFSNSGFVKFMETVFYTHRGKRAWKAANRLRVLGIPCAEPVALVEQRSFGLLQASYLLMENISGADQLDDLLRSVYFPVSGRPSREKILEKRNIVRAGALSLRSFHSKGIYHKDLSSKNVLVTLGDGGEPRFFCVDWDSIQFPLRVSLRRRIKNMAQLNGLPGCITTTDKVRFYKEYFGLTNLTPRHKIFIRIIRWISRRRVELARQADLRLVEKRERRKESYEDIASL